MTLDDYFRDQISRGQQPLVALHNAAQAYAASMKPRDCAQYADETAAWSEHQDSDEVAIHQRLRTFISSTLYGGCRVFSVGDQCQCPLCDLDRLFRLTNRSKDSEAVELLREQCQRMKKDRDNGGCLSSSESAWFYRVLKFLEGKHG